MDEEPPLWLRSLQQPDNAVLNKVFNELVFPVRAYIRKCLTKETERNAALMLLPGSMDAKIDLPREEDEKLGLILHATLNVPRRFFLGQYEKRCRIEEPAALELVGQITAETRAALANAVTILFNDHWNRVRKRCGISPDDSHISNSMLAKCQNGELLDAYQRIHGGMIGI
jgi:hypothetical protein